MVQLVKSGNLRPDHEELKVKSEIQNSFDEENRPLNKRLKISNPFQKWSAVSWNNLPEPEHCNPLEEPSPLGLRLRKSPSLLDLIQMRLSQRNPSVRGIENNEDLDLGKKNLKGDGVGATADKLKASNFPASLLRIGTWKYVSRYEGDLVAKCYFAKHKLVWEVLDGGLKSKIEIQWSDISAIKAKFPDNEPGTLDIVLAVQPLFFRETNPQPRKHTLWQATPDFTCGQASVHRKHFLQCPQGFLNKHFEKLIQCDPRLNLLCRQPEIVLESPYFETRSSVFEDLDESKCNSFDHMKNEYVSTCSGFRDYASSCAAPSVSSISEKQDPVNRATDTLSLRNPSTASVMDAPAIEKNKSNEAEGLKGPTAPAHLYQFKVLGLRPSMSVKDLVNHLEHCISEKLVSAEPSSAEAEGHHNRDLLGELTQYLLGDAHFSSASDEKSLMSRVNSLCCLLQKDCRSVQNLQIKSDGYTYEQSNFASRVRGEEERVGETDLLASSDDVPGCSKQQAACNMSRKDSLGDLLLHLPRITSLPQFLFNISEDADDEARGSYRFPAFTKNYI